MSSAPDTERGHVLDAVQVYVVAFNVRTERAVRRQCAFCA